MKKYFTAKELMVFFVLGMFIIANCWIYVSGEDNVYLWDYRGYWTTWQQYGSLLPRHLLQWLGRNEHGIRSSDYNPFPVSLLFPFYLLLGAGRFAYIVGLALVYLGITTVLLAVLLRKAFDNSQRLFVLALLVAVVFVPFWRPTLRGFPDIIGLMPIIGSVLFLMNASFSTRVSIKKSIQLGLLMWAPFLLRRWYAYTVVTLYITLPVLAYFYDRLKTETLDLSTYQRLRNIFVSFLYAGLTSVIVAYAFQSSMIRRILRTDYGYIYSAYQTSFSWSIESTLQGMGYYLLPFAALGLVFSLWAPARKSSLLCFFSLANLLISFVLFVRTQGPGMQHQLPFTLWVLIMALIGLGNIIVRIKRPAATGLVAIITIASLAIMVNALYRTGPDYQVKVLPEKNYGLRVDHFDTYLQLVDRLKALTAGGEEFAVFSSNGRLSDDLLSTISNGTLDQRMVRISQIDLRDGLNIQPFLAKYLVVADPIQLHLGGQGQDVVKFPAEELLSGVGIGRAYKRLPETYLLDGDIHGWIYQKQRSFTQEEISAFLSRFTERYPDWTEELTRSLAPVYLGATISPGDQWGRFHYDGAHTISAHPGEHRPTTASIIWNQDQMIIRSVNTRCQQSDGVSLTLVLPGGEKRSAMIANGAEQHFDTRDIKGLPIRIILDKHQTSACDGITLSTE